MKTNKWNKALAAFLSTAFVLGGAACGGAGGKEVGKDGIYTIEYYMIMNGTAQQTDLETVENAINEILEEKLKVRVNMHLISDWNYDSTMGMVINSGDNWDICFTSNWTNSYKKNVAKETFMDITDLLPEYAPTLYQNVDEKVYDALKVNDRIFGAINLQIMPRTPGFTVDKAVWNEYLTANPDFDPAAFDEISDIEGFLQYCKDNKDGYNIISACDNSGVMVALGYDDIYGVTYPGAVRVSDDAADGLTVVNQFAQEDYYEFFKMSAEWYEKGYISPDVLTKEFDYTRAYAWLETTYKPGLDGVGTMRAGKETYSFGFADPIMYNSWLSCCTNAINSACKYPEKCLQFLELLNTDKELCNMFIYGIEGKHYTKVSDNRVQVIKNSGYNMANTSWQFSNQFNAYLTDPQEDNIWEETAKMNKEASYSPLVGFNFDYSKFELELNNCADVYSEYMTSFIQGIYGDKLDSQYQAFLKKLDQAGAKKIIAEMQRQVDAWVAENNK